MDNSTYLQKKESPLKTVKNIYRSFSPEKVILFWCLFLTFSLCIFSLGVIFNSKFLLKTPTYGGSITEGILGTPRFLNPVLATTDQDKDLTSLIFAGLTKRTNNNESELDMASSVQISDDGLTYKVTLRDTSFFHDGTPVTVDDVIYTIGLIQNPAIKSPHRIEWEGVEVEKNSSHELTFTLKKPYPLFKEVLTIGILPKHIWKNLSDEQISLSDLNTKAVGSGPYKIKSIETKSGIPTSFHLESHKKYTLGRPYLEEITIKTFQSEKTLLQALGDKDITRAHGITSEKLLNQNIATSSLKTSLLPRAFTVFFNPNKSSPLSEKEIRTALNLAINKEEIVRSVLNGYGKVLSSPYAFDTSNATPTYNPEKAKELLTSSKTFKKASTTLEITLTTANTDEMKEVASMIKSYWEAIGVTTTLSVYEISDLNQSVIKDRNFEVLLFGAITESPSDLFALWHSSQRNYPGLNISNYVSKDLDSNLEILRSSNSREERDSAYSLIKKEFENESPGIFLFSPQLIYATNDKVTTNLPEYSINSSSRFALVHDWYRYSEKVWPKTYQKAVIEFIQNILH